MQFITPIYHTNIDNCGRVCLDALKMPPSGAWRPALNIATILSNLHHLLAEPNPDDGLMADITHQYKNDRASFEREARALTVARAMDKVAAASTQQKSIARFATAAISEQVSSLSKNSKRSAAAAFEFDSDSLSARPVPQMRRLGLRPLSLQNVRIREENK